MLRLISRYGSIVMVATSTLASIAVTVESLGHEKAIIAIAAAVAVTLLVTLAALEVANRQAVRSYKATIDERWRQQSTPPPLGADPVFLASDVMPAFSSAGLEETRRFFIDFITSLDLPEDRRQREEEFVNKVSERDGLSAHDKIDLMVHHFADDG